MRRSILLTLMAVAAIAGGLAGCEHPSNLKNGYWFVIDPHEPRELAALREVVTTFARAENFEVIDLGQRVVGALDASHIDLELKRADQVELSIDNDHERGRVEVQVFDPANSPGYERASARLEDALAQRWSLQHYFLWSPGLSGL